MHKEILKIARGYLRLKFSWNRIKSADGYDVFLAPYGKKNPFKLVESLDDSDVTSYAQGFGFL